MRGEHPPVIFYTGNEEDITTFYNNTLFAFEMAETMGTSPRAAPSSRGH